MTYLTTARVVITSGSFQRWRRSLGLNAPAARGALARAQRLAADVEWGARRLPFATKCLPRAVALSWMLRRKAIAHTVVLAVRPGNRRTIDDNLHAWVEVEGTVVIGELPGPWIEMYRAGSAA